MYWHSKDILFHSKDPSDINKMYLYCSYTCLVTVIACLPKLSMFKMMIISQVYYKIIKNSILNKITNPVFISDLKFKSHLLSAKKQMAGWGLSQNTCMWDQLT